MHSQQYPRLPFSTEYPLVDLFSPNCSFSESIHPSLTPSGKKQIITKHSFQDEKDGLLRFTEEALGIGDEDNRMKLYEKINGTLEKVR